MAHRITGELAGPAFRRDPAFIRGCIPLASAYAGWFSPEVRGIENLPETGPVLVVGNHSCLFWMPEVPITGLAVLGRRGVDSPTYTLAYDLLVSSPVLGPYLRRAGALPADPVLARRALQRGAAVVVYPGGDHEACRPWTERNRIDLGGRRGFVRLALGTGVPVVPAVTHGGHHAVTVLSRGDGVARLIGLPSLRIGVFPLLVGPFGVTTILAPPLPLPAAVVVEFLAPLEWSGRRAVADRSTVDRCYEETTRVMQGALDRLRAERPHPVVTGSGLLVRRLARRLLRDAP